MGQNRERLRIGMFCPYSLTVPGGVQGQVMGLARTLRRLGHEVRVLGPCDGAPPETFVTPLGDSLPTPANGSVAPIAPDPSATLRTIRALRDEEFDLLHLHEPLSPGPNLTALTMLSAPVVATFHAAGDSASYRYLNSAARSFASRIDRRVAVSPDALELAERYLGGSYTVVPNAVPLDIFGVESGTSRHPTIFFCGRHEERKGLGVLLRAFTSMNGDATLLVASDGPQTPQLRAVHGGDRRIEWLGRISEAEKATRLRSSSVFVAPSLGGESFGVVLIEAMAAGCPVVASDIDGYRNVATDEVDALLVPPDDERALAAALDRVLSDASLADALRERGLARSREFSMAEQAESYLRIYRDVLNDREPRGARAEGYSPSDSTFAPAPNSSPGLASARFYARVRRWTALLVGLTRRMLRR